MEGNNLQRTWFLYTSNIKGFFIFTAVVSMSLFVPYFITRWYVQSILSAIPMILTLYLYFDNIRLFVPSLFFAINSLMSPFVFIIIEKYKIYIPQLNFLLPIIVYIIIVSVNKKLRKEITWLSCGKPDRTTWMLIFLFSFASCIGLVIWALFFRTKLLEFTKFVPDLPLYLLILYGLAFPFFNAFFEEFIARAVLFEGFSRLFNQIMPVIFFQAAIFALWHYRGFPGGISGVVMVCIWSLFLGYLRYQSKGMLAPIIAHIIADTTIALILLFVMIIPVQTG